MGALTEYNTAVLSLMKRLEGELAAVLKDTMHRQVNIEEVKGWVYNSLLGLWNAHGHADKIKLSAVVSETKPDEIIILPENLYTLIMLARWDEPPVWLEEDAEEWESPDYKYIFRRHKDGSVDRSVISKHVIESMYFKGAISE